MPFCASHTKAMWSEIAWSSPLCHLKAYKSPLRITLPSIVAIFGANEKLYPFARK